MKKLNWTHSGFDDFDIYVHDTPGDGSCMLHAIANAYCKYYSTQYINGKYKSRSQIIRELRDSMASRLERKDINTGKTFYETLQLSETSDYYPHSMEYIQNLLRSDKSLGHESLSIMETLLGKNIFIMDYKTRKLIRKDIAYEGATSVVLCYHAPINRLDEDMTGHYETISVFDPQESCHIKHFKWDNPFIKFLRNFYYN